MVIVSPQFLGLWDPFQKYPWTCLRTGGGRNYLLNGSPSSKDRFVGWRDDVFTSLPRGGTPFVQESLSLVSLEMMSPKIVFRTYTTAETNSEWTPLKIGRRPQKECSSEPTIDFQVVLLFVSGRVIFSTQTSRVIDPNLQTPKKN